MKSSFPVSFDFIRASPSEFVIPLAKYNKAMYTQVSLGMRFRMMFETEESGVRRYMGTVTGISDLDPVRWKNSQWRNLQVYFYQLLDLLIISIRLSCSTGKFYSTQIISFPSM